MKILITGAAGFIGSLLAKTLASRGDEVVGIDNINAYYDPRLKLARLGSLLGVETDCSWPVAKVVTETGGQEVEFPDMPFGACYRSQKYPNVSFVRMDISDGAALARLFEAEKFDKVMNLAAQAGVRYSIKNPMAYVESNIVGFMNVLECCRHNDIKHLVYASSSSVYGLNDKTPFSEKDEVIRPVSIYAATKKANELMAHSYGKLYGLRSTGLRYFTVYGPWGRPDMAPMLFADAILKGREIKVFNNGDLVRDFTFVGDIVDGTVQVIDHEPEPNADGVPVKVYNIGCSNPIKLMDFIQELESALGVGAKKTFLPMQAGDVYQTYADTSLLENEVGYCPSVKLPEGIRAFTNWYKGYYI